MNRDMDSPFSMQHFGEAKERAMSQPKVPMPLAGVSQRQAHKTNAGFNHQHWVSVLAWLRLQDLELLVIEGVEDIDRISTDRAVLTQVKRHAAELKLSTKEAAVAVGNYLVALAKNSTYQLHLIYLTTAQAGIEPNTNFRTDQRGAIVWSSCANAETTDVDLYHDLCQLPELLRRPLVRRAAKANQAADVPLATTDNDNDDEAPMRNEDQALRYLSDHIAEISFENFRDTLVRNISWNVASPDTDVVMEQVRAELASYADRLEVRPKTLQECRFRLLARVMNAAAGLNQGCLTKAECEAEIQDYLETLDQLPCRAPM